MSYTLLYAAFDLAGRTDRVDDLADFMYGNDLRHRDVAGFNIHVHFDKVGGK